MQLYETGKFPLVDKYTKQADEEKSEAVWPFVDYEAKGESKSSQITTNHYI